MISETARRLFAEQILPHLDDAYALAKWLTGNASDAEDVVQDSCIRALRAIEHAQVVKARAWLLTIVRNTASSWMARNRPAQLVVTDSIETMARAEAAPDLSPEDHVIANAQSAALERAIAALPIVFREALVMREFSNLSYREIAEATQSPVGTVMSRLARARALLIVTLARERS